jgi:hypothetical protein
MRNIRGVWSWRALGGRWTAPRVARDVDDVGGMGTDLALEARLLSDPQSRVSPDTRRGAADSTSTVNDRLNARSVL